MVSEGRKVKNFCRPAGAFKSYFILFPGAYAARLHTSAPLGFEEVKSLFYSGGLRAHPGIEGDGFFGLGRQN